MDNDDDDGCHTLSEIEERWGERLVAGRVLGVAGRVVRGHNIQFLVEERRGGWEGILQGNAPVTANKQLSITYKCNFRVQYSYSS